MKNLQALFTALTVSIPQKNHFSKNKLLLNIVESSASAQQIKKKNSQFLYFVKISCTWLWDVASQAIVLREQGEFRSACYYQQEGKTFIQKAREFVELWMLVHPEVEVGLLSLGSQQVQLLLRSQQDFVVGTLLSQTFLLRVEDQTTHELIGLLEEQGLPLDSFFLYREQNFFNCKAESKAKAISKLHDGNHCVFYQDCQFELLACFKLAEIEETEVIVCAFAQGVPASALSFQPYFQELFDKRLKKTMRRQHCLQFVMRQGKAGSSVMNLHWRITVAINELQQIEAQIFTTKLTTCLERLQTEMEACGHLSKSQLQSREYFEWASDIQASLEIGQGRLAEQLAL